MRKWGRRAAAAALALALIPACAPATPGAKAGHDQEIIRGILLRYREDPRFERIDVSCVNRVVTLEGRVDDRRALEEAVRIAREQGRGSEVVSKIIVMPR